MAFCSATVSKDTVVNPTDLSLDHSLVKWTNPKIKDSQFYYQKLWQTINGEKKFVVFETPQFYSKQGLVKSFNNSDQLFVQLSDAQRSSLTVIEEFMRSNAKFTDELEAIWKKQLELNPELDFTDKFRSIYPSNSLFMKLHDEFEAFDVNHSLIEKTDLKAGYYRVLFYVSGLQYGEFSPQKSYLCGLSIKVLQVVYEERKVGICYLTDGPFSITDIMTAHESQDVLDSILNGEAKKKRKKKKKKKLHANDDDVVAMMATDADDDTIDIDSLQEVGHMPVERKRKKLALK